MLISTAGYCFTTHLRNRGTLYKRLAIFLSPAGMSLNKLSYSRPGRVWLVTSRLGTRKSLTFFYSVPFLISDFAIYLFLIF